MSAFLNLVSNQVLLKDRVGTPAHVGEGEQTATHADASADNAKAIMCWKSKKQCAKWNMMQSWRRAQEMLLSLLKDVHEAIVYRWTHSECVKKNNAGRERKLNIAHLNNLASQVALTSRTYQMIFDGELEKQGRPLDTMQTVGSSVLGSEWPLLQET